jgi:hypothetical protein
VPQKSRSIASRACLAPDIDLLRKPRSDFAVKCGYLEADVARPLYELYDRILGKLVVMIRLPEKWVIGNNGT